MVYFILVGIGGIGKKKFTNVLMVYHASDAYFGKAIFVDIQQNKFLGIRKGPGEVLYNAVDLNHYKP